MCRKSQDVAARKIAARNRFCSTVTLGDHRLLLIDKPQDIIRAKL
jgi:hypothetical protein